MRSTSKNLRITAVIGAMITVIGICSASAFGQEYSMKSGFCQNNNWSSDDHVSFSELRETTIPAAATLNVNGRQNGGIKVIGENRSDILVRSCVQASARTDAEAKLSVAAVRINTSGEIKAENPAADKNWSVSYEILVPRLTDLNLTAHNGGISISGTNSSAEFSTENGGVSLDNAAGYIKGRTANGGVKVTLTGNSWNGKGLDLQTTNGGVKITMPENYAAQVETGTVNGGFKSDIPSLNITTEDIKGDNFGRSRSRRINTSINGGGPPIRVITTNGGIKISSNSSEEK